MGLNLYEAGFSELEGSGFLGWPAVKDWGLVGGAYVGNTHVPKNGGGGVSKKKEHKCKSYIMSVYVYFSRFRYSYLPRPKF